MPNEVTVVAGQLSSGVDITVPTPASSTPPNAEFLGIGGNVAFVTGGTIQRGTANTVLMFGPGLSSITSATQVSFSGPADITASNLQNLTATDGKPGIQFTINVDPSAALGARTVILQAPNRDITAFAGGLEVTP